MPPIKQPTDRRASTTERQTEPFTWRHGDDVVELPPAKNIKAGIIRRAAKAPNEIEQIFTIFEELVNAEQLAVMDDMTMEELGDMFTAWQAHGGASLGES